MDPPSNPSDGTKRSSGSRVVRGGMSGPARTSLLTGTARGMGMVQRESSRSTSMGPPPLPVRTPTSCNPLTNPNPTRPASSTYHQSLSSANPRQPSTPSNPHAQASPGRSRSRTSSDASTESVKRGVDPEETLRHPADKSLKLSAHKKVSSGAGGVVGEREDIGVDRERQVSGGSLATPRATRSVDMIGTSARQTKPTGPKQPLKPITTKPPRSITDPPPPHAPKPTPKAKRTIDFSLSPEDFYFGLVPTSDLPSDRRQRYRSAINETYQTLSPNLTFLEIPKPTSGKLSLLDLSLFFISSADRRRKGGSLDPRKAEGLAMAHYLRERANGTRTIDDVTALAVSVWEDGVLGETCNQKCGLAVLGWILDKRELSWLEIGRVSSGTVDERRWWKLRVFVELMRLILSAGEGGRGMGIFPLELCLPDEEGDSTHTFLALLDRSSTSSDIYASASSIYPFFQVLEYIENGSSSYGKAIGAWVEAVEEGWRDRREDVWSVQTRLLIAIAQCEYANTRILDPAQLDILLSRSRFITDSVRLGLFGMDPDAKVLTPGRSAWLNGIIGLVWGRLFRVLRDAIDKLDAQEMPSQSVKKIRGGAERLGKEIETVAGGDCPTFRVPA